MCTAQLLGPDEPDRDEQRAPRVARLQSLACPRKEFTVVHACCAATVLDKLGVARASSENCACSCQRSVTLLVATVGAVEPELRFRDGTGKRGLRRPATR